MGNSGIVTISLLITVVFEKSKIESERILGYFGNSKIESGRVVRCRLFKVYPGPGVDRV